MLRPVHLLQRGIEQPFLLVPGEPAVPGGLRLLVQADAEPVKRRTVEQRGCLRNPPVHGCPQCFEDAVHRRDLHVFGVFRVGLELVDHVRILKLRQRELSEVFLEHANTTPNRRDAAEARRFDAAFHVGVEERRHVAQLAAGLHRAS
jgi:hypothetical protein